LWGAIEKPKEESRKKFRSEPKVRHRIRRGNTDICICTPLQVHDERGPFLLKRGVKSRMGGVKVVRRTLAREYHLPPSCDRF